MLTIRSMPVLIGVAAVLLGAWWLWLSDVRRNEGAELRAELAEAREALRTARQTLHLRARAIEMAESEIQSLTQELRKVRAAASDSEAPILAADDPWRTKRAR